LIIVIIIIITGIVVVVVVIFVVAVIIIMIIIICPHNQSNKDHYKKSEPDVSSGVLVKWAKKTSMVKINTRHRVHKSAKNRRKRIKYH